MDSSKHLKSERTIHTSHDLHVQNVRENESSRSCFGVKGDCVLHVSLDYFHDITDVSPHKLHGLLKGIMPLELALCFKKIITKYFSLEHLKQNSYQLTDEVNKPKPITKNLMI